MAFPTVIDLCDLTAHLDGIRPAVRWAYTGSMAMYLHGFMRGADEARFPNDIDVMTNDVPAVAFSLSARIEGAYLSDPPNPQARHAKVRQAVLAMGSDARMVPWNIDVVRAGTKFGSLDGTVMFHWGGVDHPVVSLQSLIGSKQSIVDDDDDDDGRASDDLAYLRAI